MKTITPSARRTDPQTSHLAARSVTGLPHRQAAILEAFKAVGRPMTHQQLVAVYGQMFAQGRVPYQSESGIRTRCCELVDLGRVVDSGERSRLCSGRLAIVWRAV